MPGQERRPNRKSGFVQRRGEVAERLRSVAEAVQQEDGGVTRPAQVDRPGAFYQAGDTASWLRSITYDVPFRCATPAPMSRPSASEMDSRVAPTISQMSR